MLAKGVGCFILFRRLNRNKLRILCYHGFSIKDEGLFRPRLFMAGDLFRRRMEFLRTSGYSVLSLDNAMDCVRNETLSPDSIVITIDDGFYSVFRVAFPVLRELGFPATLYLTSYYALKGTPVFPLAISYMIWKSDADPNALEGLGASGTEGLRVDVVDELVAAGSNHDEAGRVGLCREIGQRLRVDYEEIAEDRVLSLLNSLELKEMTCEGITIGLHTHRHHVPNTYEDAIREIKKNISGIRALGVDPVQHFCYPSGLWRERDWPALSACGIETAVTCEPGLVTSGTPPLALVRILDSGELSQLEFEAEITGFAGFVRAVRRWTISLFFGSG